MKYHNNISMIIKNIRFELKVFFLSEVCCTFVSFLLLFFVNINLSGLPPECQTICIIKHLSVMIWTHIVCKGHQQATLVDSAQTGARFSPLKSHSGSE